MTVSNPFNVAHIFVAPEMPLREVISRIDLMSCGIALIVDPRHHLLGTVTDGDIRRAVLGSIGLDQPVQVILDRKAATEFAKPITAPMGKSRAAYLEIMKTHSIIHLPILNKEGEVVNLLMMDDFLPEKKLSLQAVVMAGGRGTRLYPLTSNTPKPMLPVGDRPLMEILFGQLRDAGIQRVHVSTHHLSEKISDHFGDGSEFDLQVSYLKEQKPLGTAGALSMIEKTEETLLVINGDILTDLDFRAMLSFHREHKADLTVAVRQYDVKVPYGVVDCQEQAVTRITEKPVFNFFVNAGIYLLEPSARNLLPKGEERFDMTDLIRLLLKERRTVVSFPVLEQWVDIGCPQDYATAQDLVKSLKG